MLDAHPHAAYLKPGGWQSLRRMSFSAGLTSTACHLWLPACISLIVGLVLLAGSARMER